MKRRVAVLFVAVGITGGVVLGGGSVAGAHFVHVETPSGQTNCHFLGGPGNPGHAGHSHGHVKAIAAFDANDSEVVVFSGPC